MNINEIMKNSKVECDKCKRLITKNNIKKHYICCDGNPIPRDIRKNGRKRGGNHEWCKGKTFVELYGEDRAKEIIKKAKENNTFRFSKHTEESKKNISLHMMGNKNWEYSITKSGRGKKGYYKGQYFMSTWELAFIVHSMENGIEYERNWKKFEYIDTKGNKRYYIPDFIVDNTFVEIKGYMTKEVELKIKSFKLPLIVIDKEGIKPILKYVTEKYGENFYDVLKDK